MSRQRHPNSYTRRRKSLVRYITKQAIRNAMQPEALNIAFGFIVVHELVLLIVGGYKEQLVHAS